MAAAAAAAGAIKKPSQMRPWSTLQYIRCQSTFELKLQKIGEFIADQTKTEFPGSDNTFKLPMRSQALFDLFSKALTPEERQERENYNRVFHVLHKHLRPRDLLCCYNDMLYLMGSMPDRSQRSRDIIARGMLPYMKFYDDGYKKGVHGGERLSAHQFVMVLRFLRLTDDELEQEYENNKSGIVRTTMLNGGTYEDDTIKMLLYSVESSPPESPFYHLCQLMTKDPDYLAVDWKALYTYPRLGQILSAGNQDNYEKFQFKADAPIQVCFSDNCMPSSNSSSSSKVIDYNYIIEHAKPDLSVEYRLNEKRGDGDSIKTTQISSYPGGPWELEEGPGTDVGQRSDRQVNNINVIVQWHADEWCQARLNNIQAFDTAAARLGMLTSMCMAKMAPNAETPVPGTYIRALANVFGYYSKERHQALDIIYRCLKRQRSQVAMSMPAFWSILQDCRVGSWQMHLLHTLLSYTTAEKRPYRFMSLSAFQMLIRPMVTMRYKIKALTFLLSDQAECSVELVKNPRLLDFCLDEENFNIAVAPAACKHWRESVGQIVADAIARNHAEVAVPLCILPGDDIGTIDVNLCHQLLSEISGSGVGYHVIVNKVNLFYKKVELYHMRCEVDSFSWDEPPKPFVLPSFILEVCRVAQYKLTACRDNIPVDSINYSDLFEKIAAPFLQLSLLDTNWSPDDLLSLVELFRGETAQFRLLELVLPRLKPITMNTFIRLISCSDSYVSRMAMLGTLMCELGDCVKHLLNHADIMFSACMELLKTDECNPIFVKQQVLSCFSTVVCGRKARFEGCMPVKIGLLYHETDDDILHCLGCLRIDDGEDKSKPKPKPEPEPDPLIEVQQSLQNCQISSKEEEDKEDKECRCVMCTVNFACCVAVDCCHPQYCDECYDQTEATHPHILETCALCRTPVTKWMRLKVVS